MPDNPTKQTQKESRTLQAFTSLLTLVETLAAIPDQKEGIPFEETGAAAGKLLADITAQVLGCQYVIVYALDPPHERHRVLGISGLTPEQEQRLREEASQTPLTDYLNATLTAQLHANQVITFDLEHQPFVTARSTFEARYRLIAPMVLRGQLIGLLVTAKADAKYPDLHSAYSPEEMALAKGVAKLNALFIERVRLLQEWAKARANELALQETNRRYDAFITIASHELKTPLAGIKGNVQLALRRLTALNKTQRKTQISSDVLQQIERLLEQATQSSDRLDYLTHELLDISCIQAGRFNIVMKPVNLIEAVHHTIEATQQATTNRMLLLSLPKEEAIIVLADADRIEQVIAHYLTNALKYSPLWRPVEVRVEVKGLLVCVSVRDEGPGLSQEEQARVWERFYQVPGVETQYGTGARPGLGLYLCREIIKRHQGQVGMQSVPGEGSTFWFSLPLANSA